MSQSLSVVLSVRNGEKYLVEKIHKLLDMLPDLTHCFEILIIDDGSTDHTSEVAFDLSREFPQVQLIQHGKSLGWTGVVETALARSWGEFLFVQDARGPIDSSKFKRLWALRTDPDIAPTSASINAQGLGSRRMAAWAVRLDDGDQSGNGLQMIRRQSGRVTKGYLSRTKADSYDRVDRPRPASKLAMREIPIAVIKQHRVNS